MSELNKTKYQHFSVIVAGDNPDDIMKKYDNKIKKEPYVVYKYDDAESLQKKYIQAYEELIKINHNSDEISYLKSRLDKFKNESTLDFYLELTDGYNLDEKTGNAISTDNIDGKWESYRLGKNLSVPFKLKNGEESFSAIKKDIDWSMIHLANQDVYESAWDLVMNGKKPSNENEKLIYENMKWRTSYFESYGTKENYVINSTAFWAYGFLSKETGWVELNEKTNQFDWVTNFYKQFILPLPDNVRLTIFECAR